MFGVDPTLYNISVIIIIGYMVAGWLIPLGIKINYGRLKDSLSKLQFSPKLAWFLFQVPNLIWAVYFLLIENHPLSLGYALFIMHYINRDIIYPLRMKSKNKVPLEIILTAMSFTFANGYIQGIGNANARSLHGFDLFVKILGVAVFFAGMAINIKSDEILQQAKNKLQSSRQSSEAGEGKGHKKKYALINQFLFKYVSNPNYLGQIIQWFGYFLVCQNFQSALFAASTLSVLVAAAIPRNKWNKQNIQGYPKERKCVIPFLI